MKAQSPAFPKNVISVVGPSGSGKTQLIVRLLEWLTTRRVKVAVLKHSHKISVAESEPARLYRRAGARAFVRAEPHQVQITRYDAEPDLSEILASLSPQADLVIVEGYKQSPLPKIALAGAPAIPLSLDGSSIIAWVSREPLQADVPVFHPDQVEELGRLILESF